MKVQNAKQACLFPAIALCKSPISKELNKALSLKASAKSEEDKAAANAAVEAALTEPLRKELKSYGAKSVEDSVHVEIKLGSLLFDMYMHAVKPPQAPLARQLHQKKNQEIAERLTADEFEMPPEVKVAAVKVMSEDTLWKTLSVSGTTQVIQEDSTTKDIEVVLNSRGAEFYASVIDAAVKALAEETEKKDEKSAT